MSGDCRTVERVEAAQLLQRHRCDGFAIIVRDFVAAIGEYASWGFFDYRMKMDTIKRYVYKLAEKGADIHDIVEVEATNKTMTGVV